MLGAHLYECPEDSKLSLNFSFLSGNAALRSEVHNFAGLLWMFAGVLVAGGVMFTGTSGLGTVVVVLVALATPWVFGRSRANSI